MKLLSFVSTASLAIATLGVSTAADAAVTYTFAGSYTTDRNSNNDPIASQIATFTFTVPTFLSGYNDVTPSSCQTNDPRFVCGLTQRLEAYPTGFGSAVGGDYIGLNLANADGSGSGTGFYFFQKGALSAAGTYSNAGYPNPDGGYGNAGAATLLVSGFGAVPEPSTWAMLIAGFGMIGFAIRKRSNVCTTVSYA